MRELIDFYSLMNQIREAERQIALWVEDGTVKTPCHLYEGQEAIAVGVCATLESSDTLWGNHRSHGHYLAKGGTLESMMKEVLCRVTGCAEGRGGSMHLIDVESGIFGTVPIVGGTVPLAVGAALAHKMDDKKQVAVSFFGDGTIEEGHVSESINLAAVYNLPIIFVCENNLYSSHMHIRERRRKDNIVETASLYGIEGEVVDGNDIEAVFDAAQRAVCRAREGRGPTLLECRTFRWRGHVGYRMDIDVGVTRHGELAEWLEKCPIKRLKERLVSMGTSPAFLEEIEQRVKKEVAQVCAAALQEPFPAPGTLMSHVFVERSKGGVRNEYLR